MIVLNDIEHKIIRIIEKYAKNLEPVTTPRIAGGWVRDKLLGIESEDIDITLDNISGDAFARGLVKFARLDKNVHKITANPEKSKHLETAVVNLFGYDVDFVILRTETYAESRIPNIKPGTAKEDALRRDATVNALFYNIFTRKIEDFTDKGLNDLNNKVIRTPLDPLITFKDDPLRVLRIIRFHAKLDFKIDEAALKVMQNEEIHDALAKKVSSERVWKELHKMLTYKNGVDGLLILVQNKLDRCVFKQKVCTYTEALEFYQKIGKYLLTVESSEEIFVMRMFILLNTCNVNEIVKIYKEALKAPNSYTKIAEKIIKNQKLLSKKDLDNLEICNYIELLIDCGYLWKESLILFYGLNNIDLEKILKYVEEHHLVRRCFKKNYKISGYDFVDIFSGENRKQIPACLRLSRIYEALDETLTKEQIMFKVLNKI